MGSLCSRTFIKSFGGVGLERFIVCDSVAMSL